MDRSRVLLAVVSTIAAAELLALAACMGTLPGVMPNDTYEPASAPEAPAESAVRGAESGARATGPRSTAVRPAPVPTTEPVIRDSQLAVLAEAIAALRTELGRSRDETEELSAAKEDMEQKLSLMRRSLNRANQENSRLQVRLRELEKRLAEMATPAPLASE